MEKIFFVIFLAYFTYCCKINTKEKHFLPLISNIKYVSTLSLKKNVTGHGGPVYSLAVLQNGDLASGSSDQTIKIWDILTGSMKRTLTGHTNSVVSLAVLQKGDLASGSLDKTIRSKPFLFVSRLCKGS